MQKQTPFFGELNSHDGRFAADLERQQTLEQMGVTFLRFANDEVLRDMD